MLGSPCSPCCGCRCDVPPTQVLFGWGYTDAFPANRFGMNSTLYNLLYESNTEPFLQAVLLRDDSIAPYGGFGYSYSGQPLVNGAPVQSFYGSASTSATCTSFSARLFFFFARNAAFTDPSDGTTPGTRPCLRVGFFLSDSWRLDQNTLVTFSRSLSHDGLAAGSTLAEGAVTPGPRICVPDDISFDSGPLTNTEYSDTSSATVLYGRSFPTLQAQFT